MRFGLKYFIGIDVGTNSSKGAIIDEECRIIASAAVGHTVENPQPGYFEQDADGVWWKDVCSIARKLTGELGREAECLAGVGISALGCDVVPVDESCRPLRKAILYGIDSRASEEIAYLTGYYGKERMEELVGRPFNSSDCMPKILWLKNHEREIYDKAYRFLTASSFLTAKLTGEYVLDSFMASSFSPAYDKNFRIREDVCREMYCEPWQLARICRTIDIAGHVTARASEETGIPEGVPVVTGTDDSGAEAVSSGVVSPGDVMIQLGSTCYMIYCSEQMIQEPRLACGRYLVPGTYSVDGGTNAAGNLTQWLRDNMYQDILEEEKKGGENAYSVLGRRAERIPAGSDGIMVLPYFAGERVPIHDPLAKGLFFGLLLHHTRDHIYRAALESIAYGVAQYLDILKGHGLEVGRIIAAGGGAQSGAWLQIISDVTGFPIYKPEVTVGASYGDAMIAGIGAGGFPGFEYLKKAIRMEKVFYPIPEHRKVYVKGKKQYEKLYENNKSMMHMASETEV